MGVEFLLQIASKKQRWLGFYFLQELRNGYIFYILYFPMVY